MVGERLRKRGWPGICADNDVGRGSPRRPGGSTGNGGVNPALRAKTTFRHSPCPFRFGAGIPDTFAVGRGLPRHSRPTNHGGVNPALRTSAHPRTTPVRRSDPAYLCRRAGFTPPPGRLTGNGGVNPALRTSAHPRTTSVRRSDPAYLCCRAGFTPPPGRLTGKGGGNPALRAELPLQHVPGPLRVDATIPDVCAVGRGLPRHLHARLAKAG